VVVVESQSRGQVEISNFESYADAKVADPNRYSWSIVTENTNTKVRRLVALGVDILLVVALGWVFGQFFGSWLISIGKSANLVGFAIAWAYHGLTNSFLGEGQSPGKVLANIKVVTIEGTRVGVVRSMTRSIPIAASFFGELEISSHTVSVILDFLAIPVFVGFVYLTIFSPCCRSLHDYVCGTQVVRKSKSNLVPCPLSRGEILLISAFSFCFMAGYILLSLLSLPYKPLWTGLEDSRAEILSLSKVTDASISIESEKIVVQIQTTDEDADFHTLAQYASCSVLKHVQTKDWNRVIEVIVGVGYDMRIAHSWHRFDFTYPAREWARHCAGQEN